MIGVSWNGSIESMTDFEVRHGISFQNINDNDGKIYAKFGVSYQPAWVFITQDGSTSIRLGALDEVSLDRELQQLTES